MAKGLGKTGGQAIYWLAAIVLVGQAAISTPALAMDMDGPRMAPQPTIKVDNPYKSTLTPFVSRDGSPAGFGLFASSGHRTVNLAQPTSWSVNPDASTSGTAVGLGWRAKNLSATMGYVRPSTTSGADAFSTNDGAQRFRPRSMVGIGFALHY